MRSVFSDRVQGAAAGAALLLALVAAPGTARAAVPAEGPSPRLHPMEVMGLAADPDSGQPVAILRSVDDKRELRLFIDPFTAQGIALPLQGRQPPRPHTHDLIVSLLRDLNAALTKVVITDLRDNTYFATLYLQAPGRDLEVDSRPSDAIALALRVNAPILADERAFQRPAAPPGRREGQ